jgi:uncharacterized iron-regulated membrane protein
MSQQKETLRPWPDYRAIWRWHFYSNLFCFPFVIVLAVSGGIYLFKPQIDRWEERAYNQVTAGGQAKLPSAIVGSAVAAIPGSQAVGWEFPERNTDAARVLIRSSGETRKVFVHPETLEVLGHRVSDATLIRWIRALHGQLHLGVRGSYLVELVSSWTVIMIVTGLCLWWPRQIKGLGGILYPRLRRNQKIFWRDLHSVTGFWISGLVLFLLVTGLPWAKFWGEYLRQVRGLVQVPVSQDWTLGGEAAGEHASGEHEEHQETAGQRASGSKRKRGGWKKPTAAMPEDLGQLDRVVKTAAQLNLAYPVIITPPEQPGGNWAVKSDAQNRTLRAECEVSGTTGELLKRDDFAGRPLIDRLIGIGIAAHEGQLFGWPNQLLGLVAATGLVTLSCSGLVMWWRRRPAGTLGALPPLATPRFRWPLFVTVVLLAAYLPMFGISLVLVLGIDFLWKQFLQAPSFDPEIAEQEEVGTRS